MCINDAHKLILKPVLLLFLSLAMASPAASADRPDFEFIRPPSWVLGNQAMAPGGAIIEEYIPFGQSVYDWREIFTWQYFPEWPGQATTPRAVMDGLKRLRLSQNPKTEWKIISQTYNSIIYEWKVRDEPGFEDIYEIARIVPGVDGIHIFHYATKNASISLYDTREWASTLKNIELISK